MIGVEAFRRLASPLSWLELLDVRFPPAARAIMSAACGAPATADVIEAWASITEQPYPAEPPTQVILQVGRGGLKSSMSFVLGLDRLLRYDPRAFIAEGSEVLALHVAPAKPQANSIVRNGLPLAKSLAALLGGELEERSLRDGAELVFHVPRAGFVPIVKVAAADEGTVRGGAYCYLGAAEAGWFPSAASSKNTLADIRAAIVPRGVGQFPFFVELLESTNGPPQGAFYELCVGEEARA